MDPNLPSGWIQTCPDGGPKPSWHPNPTPPPPPPSPLRLPPPLWLPLPPRAPLPRLSRCRRWRWTARDHVCRPTADGTHPLIRTISATFGLQVACRHHSDPRWLLAPHGTADDAVEAALKCGQRYRLQSGSRRRLHKRRRLGSRLIRCFRHAARLLSCQHPVTIARVAEPLPQLQRLGHGVARRPSRHRRRSDHCSPAAERSFSAVQTVRSFALLPKPLTRHAKMSDLRLNTIGNGSYWWASNLPRPVNLGRRSPGPPAPAQAGTRGAIKSYLYLYL